MNYFIDFLLVALSGIGLSHILADSSIISKFKNWLSEIGKDPLDENFDMQKTWWGRRRYTLIEMLNCYQCNGFWSGITVFALFLLSHYCVWINVILYGFMISILSPLMGYFKLYMAIKTDDQTNE